MMGDKGDGRHPPIYEPARIRVCGDCIILFQTMKQFSNLSANRCESLNSYWG